MSHTFGLGLRPLHYSDILSSHPDFFECITEEFMRFSSNDFAMLEKIRIDYPVSLHGVSLSIGSTDPLNKQYLSQLKKIDTTYSSHYGVRSFLLDWCQSNKHA